jgi:hypothetical protein
VIASASFAAAAIVLGHALQVKAGFYDPGALIWMTVALVLTAAGAVLMRADRTDSDTADGALQAILAAGIAWQLVSFWATPPAAYLQTTELTPFFIGVGAGGLCIALGFLPVPALQRLWFPALLIVQFAMGYWILRWSPSPQIDVVTVHRAAISALLHGRSPYAITFRNIYGDTSFYNPALATGEWVAFGYPYPPLSLLVAVPGQLLARDYRYAELASILGAAALIGYSRPGRLPKLAAALFLTTPRLFFVLEQGWTEPVALVLLAATAFCLVRKPSWVPWAAGLLLVTKQYLVLAVPLLVRLALKQGRTTSKGILRFLVIAACAASLVTLPFVLWRFRAFVDSVVILQFREPLRVDSLSYVSWAVRAGWSQGSIYWSIAAAAIALPVGLMKTPNTASGFLASLTLATFTMFAFGSKAFCNYYFFVIGALCCSIALEGCARVSGVEWPTRRSDQTPESAVPSSVRTSRYSHLYLRRRWPRRELKVPTVAENGNAIRSAQMPREERKPYGQARIRNEPVPGRLRRPHGVCAKSRALPPLRRGG